jgi:hypothetical protein
MHCPGVGARALSVTWRGPHGGIRYAGAVACPECSKHLAPRKDGLVRKHPAPANLVPANPAPLRQPGSLVTQK